MNNWDNIRFFLAVARAGTVSRAALELRVTHATVLRRIDQFEQQLGVKLFRRLQSGYQLSDAGHAMLERATRIEVETQALQQEFSDRDNSLAGKLRVCQPESDVINLYPLYQQFTQAYPGIQLEIQATPKVIDFNQRRTDIAIRIVEKPPESLVGHRVGKIHFAAYCSRDYKKTLGKNIDWAMCNWIVWQGGTEVPAGDAHYRWLNKNLQQARIVMETSSITDMVNACKAGIGIGLITTNVASTHKELVKLDIPAKTYPRSLWLLTHQDIRDLPRVKCFMRFMKTSLNGILD